MLTLRGLGSKMLHARVVGGSTPEGEGALTGRTPISPSLGIRASAGARLADPSYAVTSTDGTMHGNFSDLAWNANGSLRLEYGSERGHFTGDVFYGHRSFYIPPSDSAANAFLQHVTSEDAARVVVGGEFERHRLRIALGAYGELLQRDIDEYADYTLAQKLLRQSLLSGRYGAAVDLDRPYRAGGLFGTVSARLSVDSDGVSLHQLSYVPTTAPSTWPELDLR